MANAFQTTAFQHPGFQGGGVTPPVVTPVVGGAGARRKRRILVKIDNETFEVRTDEEAVALLLQARQTAEQAAREVAAKVVAKSQAKAKPSAKRRALEVSAPKLVVVDPGYTDAFVQQVRAQVEAAQAAIAVIYRQAVVDELREQEEDEVIMLLLS